MGNKLNYGKLDVVQADVDVSATSQTLGWQISQFDFPSVWAESKGAGVKVAILDTAIDGRHPDIEIKGGYDFVNNRSINYYRNNYPVEGHGTHVAGIIGAKNNDKGIVGVAPECELYSCVVLGDDGSGTYGGIIRAIDWCIEKKMDVINMSLGGGMDTEKFYAAIRRAYNAGIPIIAAAGNSSWDTGYLDFPGVYNETIGVASINKEMTRSYFSSIGANIDVAAPGSDILSCTPENTYSIYSGTSMATPFVTGLVAIMIAKHRISGGNTPINNVEDVRNHLIKTTTDVDEIGQDSFTGHGIISPSRSLNYENGESVEYEPLKIVKFSDLIKGRISVLFDINFRMWAKGTGMRVFAKTGDTTPVQFKKGMIRGAIKNYKKNNP